MIKLLYKPTGNIFTLPDEEALRIKGEDRGNDYVILEAGLQEKETATITKEEVARIDADKAKEAEVFAKEDDKDVEEKVKKESNRFKKFDASDLKKLGKEELEVLAGKLGISDPHNHKKAELIAKIEELTGTKA